MWKVLLLTSVACISSLAACPHRCQCFLEEELRVANCSGSALTTTHQQPSQIDVLNVRPHYSGFRTKLSSRGFKNFKNLKFLNLANTSISIIPDEVFYALNYIITIDLSYNKIKHLNGGVFKELSTLQTLLIRGNTLILTKSDVIVSKSLRKLDMGNCGLRSIPQGTFAHVLSLTALFLDGNFIQTLGYHSVPTGLSYLNLANNNIVNIPTDVLHPMKSLTRIDMSGNPVKCTCQLLLLQDEFSGQGRTFENDIVCNGPVQFYGQKLSQINENDLCNLEFMKKERFMNSIKHFRDVRSYRKHNMIKSPYDDDFDIQGDQPHISDDLPNHEYETLFENEGTRSMGTHMAVNSYSSHFPKPTDISDENNKLADSKLTTDPSSTEVEVISSEHEDPPQDLIMPEHPVELVKSDVTEKTVFMEKDEATTEQFEEMNEEEASPTMKHDKEETAFTDSDTMMDEAKSVEPLTSESSEKEDKEVINTKESSELPTVSVDAENHTEHSEGIREEDFTETKLEPIELADTTIIHDTEELTNDKHNDTGESLLENFEGMTSQMKETSASSDDVEEVVSATHNFTKETSAKYTGDDDVATGDFLDTSEPPFDDLLNTVPFTTSSPEIEPYTWPTSHADLTDYSYDAQHYDYSSIDPGTHVNSTHNETGEHSSATLTTEVYSKEEVHSTSTETTPSFYYGELDEGSGEAPSVTISNENDTVKWMDEQENETTTDDYSVESVSQLFNVTSETSLSHYTSENASSSETLVEDYTTSPEISSSSSSVESDATTDIEETTTIGASSTQETASEVIMASSTTSETEVEEIITTEAETSAGTEISSSSGSYSSVSSVSVAVSEEATTEAVSSSTESTPIVVPVHDTEQDELSSTSHPTISEQPSSELPIDISKQSTSITIDSSSSTPTSEVEFVSKTVHIDEKENMILDPRKQEVGEDEDRDDGPDIAMISIIAVILLIAIAIVIIGLAVVCRVTKRPKNKIRLPVDAEANAGTEMQDMLLPKPPENGVKVLPKNYTNGTTQANGHSKAEEQREEERPVLEPEVQDWEDKPEPVETVTARLTMLARPQTPVFIPKTLN